MHSVCRSGECLLLEACVPMQRQPLNLELQLLAQPVMLWSIASHVRRQLQGPFLI